MPFTLAHPAVIWPLRRAPHQQLLPLIIGSLAPDLPDFMPGRISQHFELTHTLVGSVLEDAPLGMVMLLVLVALRVPLTELLGSRARPFFRDILERFAQAPRSWLLAPLFVLAGVWTHLLWDSFTHEHGWMVRHLALLRSQVTVLGYTGELSHVLQYASSVLGLAAVLLWIRASISAAGTPARPRPCPAARDGLQAAATPFAQSLPGSTLVLAGVLVAAVVIGVTQAVEPAQGQSWYRVFSLLLTRTMAWFGLLYVLAGTVASLRQRMPPSPQG
jgi:hypothetical protein